MRLLAHSIALLALLAFPASANAWSWPSHRFASMFERTVDPGSFLHIADTDGDGNDEVLVDNERWLMRFRTLDFRNVYPESQGNYLHKGPCVGMGDATGDGRPEFFVHMHRPDGQYLAVHDWHGPRGPSSPIFVLGPFLPPNPRSLPTLGEGMINFYGCWDLTGDSSPAILIGIVTYYNQDLPRSLMAFDGTTGTKLWEHAMGPQPHLCKVASTANGKRAVLTTFAANNGEVWNDTADSFSYLFSIAGDYSSQARMRISGAGTDHCVDVADLSGDGFHELVVGRGVGPKEEEIARTSPEHWTIAVIDPADLRVLRAVDIGTGVKAVRAADLDGDLVPEILAVGMDGALHIMNSDLSRRGIFKGRALVPYSHTIVDVCDLDGNGSPEILLMGTKGLLVLDARGRLKAEENMPWPYQAGVAAFKGRRYVVVRDGSVIRGLALEKAQRGIAWMLLVGTGVAGAGAIAAIVIRRRRVLNGESTLSGADANDRLLVAMTAFGHGASSMRVIDRLRFHLKNWPRTGGGSGDGAEVFAGLVADFDSVLVPEIRQIAFLARRAGVPRRFKETLDRRAEEASRLLGRCRVAGAAEAAGTAKVAAALGALDELSDMIGGINRHLREVFSTPVGAALGGIIARRREDLERKGCAARLRVACAGGDAAFVSPVAFERIFDGLIDNAIEAVGSQRECVVELSVTEEGGSCIVDVRDTGRGIDAADLERIFDRHYTTKAEGGFGLFFAREELAKYGGKIFVHASQPGAGTTMRVVMRKSEQG